MMRLHERTPSAKWILSLYCSRDSTIATGQHWAIGEVDTTTGVIPAGSSP